MSFSQHWFMLTFLKLSTGRELSTNLKLLTTGERTVGGKERGDIEVYRQRQLT